MSRATRARDVVTADGLDAIFAPDRASWRAWLERHHATARGVWLVYFKVASGRTRLAYSDAVEEALCFGWIDSRPNKIDDERYMQLFTPRKTRSAWSRINKERIARLDAAGLLAPAGRAKIEEARSNGSWESLDAAEAFEMHADLQTALDANEAARVHFDAFPASTRKGLLAWVAQAKRAETRARRIEELIREAEAGRRAGPFIATNRPRATTGEGLP